MGKLNMGHMIIKLNMGHMIQSVCVIICATLICSVSGYNELMKQPPLRGMTRVDPLSQVLVFQYESPLCIEQFGHKLGWLNLFHTSLGAILPNGRNATLEFAADDFPGVFLHQVCPNASSVVWNNSATVRAKEGILDTRYWTRRRPLGAVSGSTYNQLLDWGDSEQHSRYSAYYMWNLNASNTTQINSVTCDDFVRDLVRQLRLSVNIFGDAQQLHAAIGSVALVDTSVEQQMRELVLFYQHMHALAADIPHHPFKAIEMISNFLASSNRTAYVYSSGRYYRFRPTFPFVSYHYSE